MARHDEGHSVPAIDGRVAVAIPVHNKADFITPCLMALAHQTVADPFDVVVLLNNCSDGTDTVVARLASHLPYRLQVHEYWLDPKPLNASVARRLAMQHATSFAGPSGVLLTTDADGRVPADWIEANLRHIYTGCDAVAGKALLDPADEAMLPASLIEEEARVVHLGELLDEIDSLLDPNAFDPFPRHTEHSGASIAVRAEMHARTGGFSGDGGGEDRRFFESLRLMDAKIRHAPEIVVTVSGRLAGRAAGGMAETISRRMRTPDVWLDDNLESTSRHVFRVRQRVALRRARRDGLTREGLASFSANLRVAPGVVERALLARSFGAGWADLQRLSPTLKRAPVPAADLAQETGRAVRALGEIKARLALSRREHPVGNAAFAAAAADAELVSLPE